MSYNLWGGICYEVKIKSLRRDGYNSNKQITNSSQCDDDCKVEAKMKLSVYYEINEITELQSKQLDLHNAYGPSLYY